MVKITLKIRTTIKFKFPRFTFTVIRILFERQLIRAYEELVKNSRVANLRVRKNTDS